MLAAAVNPLPDASGQLVTAVPFAWFKSFAFSQSLLFVELPTPPGPAFPNMTTVVPLTGKPAQPTPIQATVKEVHICATVAPLAYVITLPAPFCSVATPEPQRVALVKLIIKSSLEMALLLIVV